MPFSGARNPLAFGVRRWERLEPPRRQEGRKPTPKMRRFWLNLPIGAKGAAVISIPVACLVVLLFCMAFLQRAQVQAKERVLQSHEVQLEAERLLGALADAETGVRGYDLNRDPTF